jgi:hypothetical protein
VTGGVPEHDSISAFTRGDTVEAEQLRRALTAIRDQLRDQPGGDQVAGRIDAVLSGRQTLRALTRDPAFLTELGRGMDRFSAEWAELSPEERVALARRGQRETDVLREGMGLPPESDPAPIGEFGPALTDPESGER